jgi:hypothetical protein
MAWDQRANTRGVEYTCGKCGGNQYYVAVQVMAQGRTNTFTKNVEVITCKACDVPMMRRATKAATRTAIITIVVLTVLFVAGAITVGVILTP